MAEYHADAEELAQAASFGTRPDDTDERIPLEAMSSGVDALGAWFDFESSGELYRWRPEMLSGIVIGPDGTEYDAGGFAESWGVDLESLRGARCSHWPGQTRCEVCMMGIR